MQNTKRDLISIYQGIIEKYQKAEKDINKNLAELEGFVGKIDFDSSLRIISQQINSSKNKFTIAIIGEVKAGKSTTLNTILGLQGEARLSSEFLPDTAKAIRIMKKEENQNYEAEIIFKKESGFATEKMSWSEAKQYTSQVKLDSDRGLERKSKQIDEIRYYVDNDLLDSCNFLDLPGHGYNGEHDRVLSEKANECDAVMWIVSNLNEPGKNALDNLRLLKKNLIPVVNIMYSSEEKKDIEGLRSFEEMKEFLKANFQSYLGEFEIIRYCAKAVDLWMQDEIDLEEAFGYSQIKETIYELLHGEIDLEEEKKQRTIDNVREVSGIMAQQIAHIVEKLQEYKSGLTLNRKENAVIKGKIERAYAANLTELNSLAGNTAKDIIEKMQIASELFIENKMATTSISIAIRTMTKKGREKLEKDLEEEYIRKYLEIDESDYSDSWIDAMSEEFRDNFAALCINEYLNADIEQNDLLEVGKQSVKIDPRYFDAIGQNMAVVFKKQMKADMPTIIATILAYIPGHEIADIILLLASVMGKFGKSINKAEDRLTKHVEQVKRRARHSISLQKVKIKAKYKDMGIEYNKKYKEELLAKMKIKEDALEMTERKIQEVFTIEDELKEYMRECNL